MPELAEKQHQHRENPVKTTRSYLAADTSANVLAEFELLLLSIATGIIDAVTFPDYQCFVSNQTRNTVELAAAIFQLDVVGRFDSEHPLFVPANVGVSLACFAASALAIGQLGNIVGPRRRGWLLVSNVFQTALFYAAAALRHWHRIATPSRSSIDLAVLSLLAIGSGAQVALSRELSLPEIPTAMATAAWVDFMVDPDLWKKRNRRRDRRIAFLLALFAGGNVGSAAKQHVTSSFAMLLSAIIKTIVTVLFLVNKSEVPAEGDEKQKERGTQASVSK